MAGEVSNLAGGGTVRASASELDAFCCGHIVDIV